MGFSVNRKASTLPPFAASGQGMSPSHGGAGAGLPGPLPDAKPGPLPPKTIEEGTPRGGQTPGCRQAWLDRLIREEGPSILCALWRILGNEEDVLEAYQECWCALAALGRPGELRCAKAFAYRTAVNVAIEMIRRRARRRGHWPAVVARYGREAEEPPTEAGSVRTGDDAGIGDLMKERLRFCLEKLAAHLQRVVVLRDLGGMSYRQVADILGIDSGTARVYRRQAMLRLAELMGTA